MTRPEGDAPDRCRIRAGTATFRISNYFRRRGGATRKVWGKPAALADSIFTTVDVPGTFLKIKGDVMRGDEDAKTTGLRSPPQGHIGLVVNLTAMPDLCVASRSTLVVHGRLARRESLLAEARNGRHGLQVMSFEQAAVRLAGGFIRPIDNESLRVALQAVLPATPMGELESIKTLPGMIHAAADTLHKAWRAGIDLKARAADHPRPSTSSPPFQPG